MILRRSHTNEPEPSLSERARTRGLLLTSLAGVAVLALTLVAYILTPLHTLRFSRISIWDGYYKRALLRLSLIHVGVFLAALCMTPAIKARMGLVQRWRDRYIWCALLAICLFLGWFIVHFGRWQFGGYDQGILVETGWRQILGQRPYVDFPATTPAGFNLGIKYAFELFGVNWDANLYFSAIFACITFLWMYWLMTNLAMRRLTSAVMAFTIQCAAMLTLCFWWYNNSALILAAVFFLSCMAYARDSRPAAVQISYFVSLVLLSLMKPNIAGITIVGGVTLLLILTDRKLRLAALTLAAAVSAVGLLALNHVSAADMVASYLSVAKTRGGLAARYGYREMTTFEKRTALLWLGALSLPLLGLVPRVVRQIKRADWKGAAFNMFYPLGLAVALYGLATNGEFRDVECTALLAAGGVLTFGAEPTTPMLRRAYIAILCAGIAGDLYIGALRVRVYSIGPYFEWYDNGHVIESGFFQNMRASSTMIELEREVKDAVNENSGPYFFGPRLDFNYAVLRLPSPDHFPAWWDPGTSVPRSEVPRLIEVWQKHRFETLIVHKDDLPFYPPEFIHVIEREYARDDEYPQLWVYRRRGTQ